MIHRNSIESFRSLNIGERCAVVLAAFADSDKPLTDRQAMLTLGFTEMNQARPRITELLEGGYLKEVGIIKCEYTNKTVRLCTITEKVERKCMN